MSGFNQEPIISGLWHQNAHHYNYADDQQVVLPIQWCWDSVLIHWHIRGNIINDYYGNVIFNWIRLYVCQYIGTNQVYPQPITGQTSSIQGIYKTYDFKGRIK